MHELLALLACKGYCMKTFTLKHSCMIREVPGGFCLLLQVHGRSELTISPAGSSKAKKFFLYLFSFLSHFFLISFSYLCTPLSFTSQISFFSSAHFWKMKSFWAFKQFNVQHDRDLPLNDFFLWLRLAKKSHSMQKSFINTNKEAHTAQV
jgi:hypothetical protein